MGSADNGPGEFQSASDPDANTYTGIRVSDGLHMEKDDKGDGVRLVSSDGTVVGTFHGGYTHHKNAFGEEIYEFKGRDGVVNQGAMVTVRADGTAVVAEMDGNKAGKVTEYDKNGVGTVLSEPGAKPPAGVSSATVDYGKQAQAGEAPADAPVAAAPALPVAASPAAPASSAATPVAASSPGTRSITWAKDNGSMTVTEPDGTIRIINIGKNGLPEKTADGSKIIAHSPTTYVVTRGSGPPQDDHPRADIDDPAEMRELDNEARKHAGSQHTAHLNPGTGKSQHAGLDRRHGRHGGPHRRGDYARLNRDHHRVDEAHTARDRALVARVEGHAHHSRAEVRAEQQALNRQGMNAGRVDGVHGEKTAAAASKFLTPT